MLVKAERATIQSANTAPSLIIEFLSKLILILFLPFTKSKSTLIIIPKPVPNIKPIPKLDLNESAVAKSGNKLNFKPIGMIK